MPALAQLFVSAQSKKSIKVVSDKAFDPAKLRDRSITG